MINIWTDNNIYSATGYVRHIKIDALFNVIADSIIENTFLNMIFRYLAINEAENKVLLISSEFTNISMGSLFELNLESNQFTLLKDSSYNISSALYLHSSDNECIYYSYGNQNIGLRPGYYFLNISSGIDSLILEHSSDMGSFVYKEFVNGFDITSDDKNLLIPIHRADLPAQMAYYNLETKQLDILDFEFSNQFVWLRYNVTGSQILFCTYPWGIGDSNADEPSEIGIIDVSTFSLRILDVKTNYPYSMSVFPNWSPDNKHIVFGSTKGPVLEPPGAVGIYSIYILKNVN